MKKMTFFAVMLMVAAALTSCGAKKNVAQNGYQQPPYYQQPYAQQPPQQNPYQQQPTYQQPPQQQPTKRVTGPEAKVREWEAKGMELIGSAGMLDMYQVASEVYAKFANNRDKYVILSGIGQHQSPSGARQAAQLFAIMEYATSAGVEVKGRFDREFATTTEMDKLIAAYAGNIQSKLAAYMNEELGVQRKVELPNGKQGYECERWWTLDESKLKRLRQEAMEQALQETATEQTMGNAIREYVNEAVPGNIQ